LPERSIQSPTRLVCSTVNGGSTRTASVAPEMRVVEIAVIGRREEQLRVDGKAVDEFLDKIA